MLPSPFADCRACCICCFPFDPIHPRVESRYELVIDGKSINSNCRQGYNGGFLLTPNTPHLVELKSTGVSGFLKSIIGSEVKSSITVTVQPGETKNVEILCRFRRCESKHESKHRIIYFEEKYDKK